MRLPVEWLRQCCIVDTPGTNAVIARHAQLTERIVPRADIIVFVTSADRPFSESERLFLSTIKSFHKKVVIVVNKTDIVRTDAEVEAVLDFVRMHGRTLLGHTPEVFGVSAQVALESKLAAGATSPSAARPAVAAEWERSRFGKFEVNLVGRLSSRTWQPRFHLARAAQAHIHALLSAESRVARKLLTPLGVAEQLTSDALVRVAERKRALKVRRPAPVLRSHRADENALPVPAGRYCDARARRGEHGAVLDRPGA